MNQQQRAVWEKVVELLEENREYIEANERPEYLALYDKGIADANALLMQPEPEAWMRPNKWTLLLVGDNHGLVGKFGCRFVGHPEHYVRVDVYAAAPQPVQEPAAWVEYETGNHTKRPQNCGTGYCSCIECPFKKGGA
jgi:hypothetical protein